MARAIRLKEFPASTNGENRPSDWYVAARDSSLVQESFRLATDEHGFILPEPTFEQNAPSVIFIGDSVLEGLYSRPENRLCSCLQSILKVEYGIDIAARNGGYSGATVLHSFNTFINKVVPLRPKAVVVMTGMIDAGAANVKATFWSNDCWLEPIIRIGEKNTWRDNERPNEPLYVDQERLMRLFAVAGKIFELPLWFATLAHQRAFGGEYVTKTFDSRAAFDAEVSARLAVNDVTRRVAAAEGVPLFDLESDLANRSDIFYDMFHLNPAGGEAVARSFIRCGVVERLESVGVRAATERANA